MNRATWRVLAFGALMAAVALPASAQVVIGGSGQPNVEVNWSVLDSLGRQPTLADMLKNDVPVSETRAAMNQPSGKAVQFRPYKTEKAKPARKLANAPAAPKAKKPAVIPAAAKAEPAPVVPAVAQLVQAAQKAEPVKPEPKAEAPKAEAPKAEAPKAELPKVSQPPAPPKPAVAALPETPKPAGPQISLPEVPKPVQVAKVEAPPAPPAAAVAPAPAPKAEPAVLPPTALTPPPAPAAKVEPKPEPAPQLASIAPAASAPAVSSKGDTLTIGFGANSARLPDSVQGELDKLVKRMQKDDGLGLQLLAYAEGEEADASKARRLSLSRALEVRKYLMEQGIRSTRIEVRALGNKMEGSGPADRVDAVVVSR